MADTPTFYIFHGEDSIRLGDALAKMRAAMGDDGDLNISEFVAAESTVPEIIAAAKSYPFLAEKRLVIVKGLINHITRRGAGQAGKLAAEQLVDELPQLPDFSRLVLVESESLAEKNRVLSAAKKLSNGYIAKFEAPKQLKSWIIDRARDEYQTEITPRAADAIASVVNDDLLRADNELFKLVCYVDGDHAIDEIDVAALTPYVPVANVFEMVDALATGDGGRALELIHRSLRDNPRDPGFALFTMIVRQFRMLLMAKDHLTSGGGSQAQVMARELGVHRYVAGKLGVQSRAFNLNQLETILKRLQRYDQDMKTGRIEPRLALDLLVSSLAR